MDVLMPALADTPEGDAGEVQTHRESAGDPVEYREIDVLVGYRIGDNGTLWSQWNSRGRLTGVWRLLKCHDQKDKKTLYARVKTADGQKNLSLGSIVLMAFIGPKPDGMECCHRDGNYLNCRKDNLRWGTHQSNMDDRDVHATTIRETKMWSAKLSYDDVAAIRLRASNGEMLETIAVDFSIHPSHASRVVNEERWRLV